MISVEEARSLVLKHAKALGPVELPVAEAIGSVLYGNVNAPVNLPPFDQSAVDGYAVRAGDVKGEKQLRVIGEAAAGTVFGRRLAAGEAVRIFTGAALPEGADAVVMQENTVKANGAVTINDNLLVKGSHIGRKASQVRKGKMVMPKGSVITPAAVGFLAAMGLQSVKVVGSPGISVLVTGSELAEPGSTLREGQKYECNSYALDAALRSIQSPALSITRVGDNARQILAALRKAQEKSDLILVTGGISVGDHDLVADALGRLGVKKVFYRVRQKPGKPLFFGVLEHALVFGLPGNPAAVLSCFYEYVLPAIMALRGRRSVLLKSLSLPVAEAYPKKKGLSFFLKGRITGNCVLPLGSQESNSLGSFALADCLIYLPEQREDVKTGEKVEVHMLPHLA